MKSLIAAAFVVFALPAVAQAQEKKFAEDVGAWKVTGTNRDCMAGMITPGGMLMVASPASGGENQGGIIIAKAGLTVAPGGGQSIVFSGPGAWAGTHSAMGMDGIPAYWVALSSTTVIDAFPDSFPMKVTKDGATLVDLQVTGFAAARSALRRCVQQTS